MAGTEKDFKIKKGLIVTEDIELGHASDTTIARASAGVISVEGVVVPTISSASTLTNKTIAVSQVTELSNLTADEGAQLENIGTTTISAAQWGYVGGLTAAKVIDWSTSQQFDDIHPNNQHSAGTNLTLSGTTLNVDDAFLKNDANDLSLIHI